MRRHAFILVLAVLGCSDHGRELPMVRADDPLWQLNPDRWDASVNDLTVPPGEGTPRSLPAAVRLRPEQVAAP
jgi:hypothetical protein